MKQCMIWALAAVLAIVIIPSVNRNGGQATREIPALELIIEDPEPGGSNSENTEQQVQPEKTVRLLHEGVVYEYPEQAYLTAVVLCEMPPDFEPEALKAQAVAARTFARKQMQSKKHENADVCSDPGCCQAWIGENALREKYAERYDAVWQKASESVCATTDEVLCYNGDLIDATYFSCSGGRTEAAVSVWGGDVPYLQSVRSPGEEDAPRFSSVVRIDSMQFRDTILSSGKGVSLTGKPESWIEEVTYTSGGGVDTMRIGGAAFRGTELRKMFGLNSTNFSVSVAEDGITFDVHGFGHRVGMSQYGAENMAEQGFDYRSILLYYYQGVKIEKKPAS